MLNSVEQRIRAHVIQLNSSVKYHGQISSLFNLARVDRLKPRHASETAGKLEAHDRTLFAERFII